MTHEVERRRSGRMIPIDSSKGGAGALNPVRFAMVTETFEADYEATINNEASQDIVV